MTQQISRRMFATLASGIAVVGATELVLAQDVPKVKEAPKSKDASKSKDEKAKAKAPPRSPVEAPFQRDYPVPGFQPGWKKPQINRLMLQDFVIFAHMDLSMVKKLVAKEPLLVNGLMDWGGGDWESGLGGATHMGRRDIVDFLLASGARIDIFCAAMMGQIDAIRSFLTLQPKLIDSRGPHGITLHDHAYIGGKQSEKVFDYLQSIRKVEIGRMAKMFRELSEKKPDDAKPGTKNPATDANKVMDKKEKSK